MFFSSIIACGNAKLNPQEATKEESDLLAWKFRPANTQNTKTQVNLLYFLFDTLIKK